MKKNQSNQQVRLQREPQGAISPQNFVVTTEELSPLAPGMVRTGTLYLSLDPVMRKMMNLKSNTARGLNGAVGLRAGDVMRGRTVSRVVESDDPNFSEGDIVLGWGGWQTYADEHPTSLERIDSGTRSPSTYLSVLGRPGITAWLGIMHTAAISEVDTVSVSSAAGAVGSIAGQIAKILGARVIGIAGGRQKCEWLTSTCGFDASVDYKADDFEQQLRTSLPRGSSAHFEGVGGPILDAVLGVMADSGRIALCGLLDSYEARKARGYPYTNFGLILDKGLRIEGFRIDELSQLHEKAKADLVKWFDQGLLAYEETVTDGLENAPQGFVNMLAGHGFGKHLVKI